MENLAFHVKEARNEVGAVWKRKKDEGRFMRARDGDMWMSLFQCNICWFVNMEKKLPIEGSRVDDRLLGYIRRVNLDLLWSSEPGTVRGTLTQVRKMKRMCEDLGIENITLPVGPWPVEDTVGFKLGVIMVRRASQEKGRNDTGYVQFDSIRKIRSAFSNIYESSAVGNTSTLAFRGEKGRAYRYSTCYSESRFFAKFSKGLESRMGRLIKSNVG
jgi:hypothetical protein